MGTDNLCCSTSDNNEDHLLCPTSHAARRRLQCCHELKRHILRKRDSSNGTREKFIIWSPCRPNDGRSPRGGYYFGQFQWPHVAYSCSRQYNQHNNSDPVWRLCLNPCTIVSGSEWFGHCISGRHQDRKWSYDSYNYTPVSCGLVV